MDGDVGETDGRVVVPLLFVVLGVGVGDDIDSTFGRGRHDLLRAKYFQCIIYQTITNIK